MPSLNLIFFNLSSSVATEQLPWKWDGAEKIDIDNKSPQNSTPPCWGPSDRCTGPTARRYYGTFSPPVRYSGSRTSTNAPHNQAHYECEKSESEDIEMTFRRACDINCNATCIKTKTCHLPWLLLANRQDLESHPFDSSYLCAKSIEHFLHPSIPPHPFRHHAEPPHGSAARCCASCSPGVSRRQCHACANCRS